MQAERNTHVLEDTDYHFKSFIPYTFGERSLNGPPPLIPSLVAKQLLEKKRQKSSPKFIDKILTYTEHGKYVQLPPSQYQKRSDVSVYSCSPGDNTFGNHTNYHPDAYHPEGSNHYITIQDKKLDRTMRFLTRKHANKYLNRNDTAHDKIAILAKFDDARPKTQHEVSVEDAVSLRKNVDGAFLSSAISRKTTYSHKGVRCVDNRIVYADNKSNCSEKKLKAKSNRVEDNNQIYLKGSNGKNNYDISCSTEFNQEKGSITKDPNFANCDPKSLHESLDREKINETSMPFKVKKHERAQSKTKNYKNNDVNMKEDVNLCRLLIDNNTSNQINENKAPKIDENVTRRDNYKETIAKETLQNVKIDHVNMRNSETHKKKTKRRGIMGRIRKRGYIYDPKPIISKSAKSNEKSNDNLAETTNIDYWAKRRRNNEAAKKSREDRRRKEIELIKTANNIKIERDTLRARVEELEYWISNHIKSDSNINCISNSFERTRFI